MRAFWLQNACSVNLCYFPDCTESVGADMQFLCPVAVSKGAVKELLACCNKALGPPLLPDLALPAACALTTVLASDGARDEFVEQDGPTALTALLEASEGTSPWLMCLHALICMWILRGSTSMHREEPRLAIAGAAPRINIRKQESYSSCSAFCTGQGQFDRICMNSVALSLVQ